MYTYIYIYADMYWSLPPDKEIKLSLFVTHCTFNMNRMPSLLGLLIFLKRLKSICWWP